MKYDQKGMDIKLKDYDYVLIFYYITSDGCVTYDGNKDKKCIKQNTIPRGGQDDENKVVTCIFEMGQSYDKTEEQLIKYYKLARLWNNEIIGMTYSRFNFLAKFKVTKSVLLFFKFCCNKYIKDFEQIDRTESNYIEQLRNGGLIYCEKDLDFESVKSYDRNHFYQYVLGNVKSNFKFPTKKGKEYVLEELPDIDDLQYGFYKVKITSNYKSINKLFVFNSRTNWYHYYDIKFLLENKKLLKPKIELIDDGKPNAYLYKSTIYSNTVFGEWYGHIQNFRENNPKNEFAKILGSRCWGVISEMNKFSVTEEEYQKNYDKYKDKEILRTKIYGEYGEPNYREIHYLSQDTDEIYTVNNMRIKGHLNSYCRVMMANSILNSESIDDVVRIHTDCISLINAKQYEDYFDNDKWKPEPKTSGLIKFSNCNLYVHKCKKCSKSFNYYYFKKHEC